MYIINFIQQHIIFYLAIALVLFLPGYVLLLAIFGKSGTLSALERFVVSLGLSLVSVDVIFFAINRLGIKIDRLSVFTGIIIFSLVNLLIFKLRKFKEDKETSGLFSFTKPEFILIMLLVFLTIFIKTAYLSGSILPTSTDMGHHMYWSNWIVQSGTLPNYSDVADPATFIVGEHIPFAAIQIFSGAGFLSAFPQAVLFLFNLFGILAVFILVLRIFENRKVAILSLLFAGVLYAVSSPQAKYVSGGVVGNILGNFLVPLVFYFYCRALAFLKEDNFVPGNSSKAFLSLAIMLTFGLFYTHHLTAFIFLFIFACLVMLFLAANYRDLEKIFPAISKIIFSAPVITALAVSLIFFFWVFTPTYVSGGAVDMAVGVASKSTRTGLTFKNLRGSAGEARMALGIVGIMVLIFSYRRKNIGYAIITAWTIMIYVMSSQPHLLFINLPSSRIGNYLTYPVAILGAYSFWWVFKNPRLNNLVRAGFFVILAFVLVGGLSDSAGAFKTKISANELSQTFDASKYLSSKTATADKILKDHNYVTADSWMKIFFMRGYRYPDSRGLFGRYENSSREQCTLLMISEPNGETAQKCYADSGTNFLVVNPRFDGGQFKKLDDFSEVYAGPDISVFYKKN